MSGSKPSIPPDLTPEQWRRIFLDLEASHLEQLGLRPGERFFSLRSAKGLTSGEHFVRYLFAAGFGRGRRVLDMGCGSGYGAYILHLLGARQVVGVDSDPAVIDFARQHYGTSGLEFHAADAAAGPPGDDLFDVIVAFETLEHLEDPESFLEQARRRLAPEGLFLVSCPHDARSPWPSPFHLRRYTYQEFRDLVGRYFPDPKPVSQIHGIASLILPLEAAGADNLAPQPLLEAYLDVAKPVEESDVFLLLCGQVPPNIRPAAVITKNLSELLLEVYAGANYIRDRVPRLESEVAQTRRKLEQQADQLRILDRRLEDHKAYTLELEHSLDEMRYSRTWQVMLACREAVGSPARLLKLPLRLVRILIDPPVPPAPAAAAETTSGVLPSYRPHRQSTIVAWPADRPVVTVGIPCYNYGCFVREAIDTVLASTFRDFEIIVVNDGSTDPETLAVLGELEQNPPLPGRFRVAHQKNQGLAAARNKGAALARGKYVVSLDADDRIAPTYLEKALWVLEHDPRYAFCYSLVELFGAEEGLWKTERFDLEKVLRQNHVATAAVFRREAWVEAGGFRDGLYGQDDWNLWITFGAKGWRGYLIEEPLFFYRKHESSMWTQLDSEVRERTSEKIQSLHSYVTGDGDSRAAEEFGRPQDPVVRAALDHPEPLPDARCSLIERPYLKFGDGRPALLFAIPWMSIGGAEQVVLQVMQGLAGEYGLAVVTTLDARQDWEAEFHRLTPWTYHLARLPLKDPAAYLRDLISVHNISGLVVSGSAAAYQALPVLKQNARLWTADIVHNTVPEGYLQTSVQSDRHLDCHFAVGEPQRDGLLTGGVAARKIRLAPTSADAQGRFNPATYAARLPEIRYRLGLQGNEIVLTYTGRLAPEKDVPLFVRTVGHVVRAHPMKRFRAFIVGDGAERARVEQQVRLQGLQNVIELLGFSDRGAEVLAVSRFVFLTSRFEGSSITLLEAMSMRQVVLSADVGSVRDVIEDGLNGFVIASREPGAFAARVTEVLADPGREAQIRERARQTILDRYDLPAMIRVYADAIAAAFARVPQTA